MKHSLLWISILLVIIWVIARVVLAITSHALHLLWVSAVILFILWLVRKIF
jgi:hypothetical protein